MILPLKAMVNMVRLNMMLRMALKRMTWSSHHEK
jgi:hypothetical protein